MVESRLWSRLLLHRDHHVQVMVLPFFFFSPFQFTCDGRGETASHPLCAHRPYGKPVPYKRFWAGYEQIMASFQGRPHWAKAHSVTYERLERSYPRMREFTMIRQRLDPEGMFLNDYLGRHLVPSSQVP